MEKGNTKKRITEVEIEDIMMTVIEENGEYYEEMLMQGEMRRLRKNSEMDKKYVRSL